MNHFRMDVSFISCGNIRIVEYMDKNDETKYRVTFEAKFIGHDVSSDAFDITFTYKDATDVIRFVELLLRADKNENK